MPYDSLRRWQWRATGMGVSALFITSGALAAYDQAARYAYTGNLHFDIQRVPFSRFGSYLSISDMSHHQLPYREDGFFLRTLHNGSRC
jgi:hypothetical protein